MINYIKTGIYHLDIRESDQDIAHIYEHLLIESFRRSLAEHNFSKYLYGWISGETFANMMFIEYGFYQPAIEDLFIRFIESPERIDFTLLNNELERVQAEEKAVFDHFDKEIITHALKELDKALFISHTSNVKSEYINSEAMLIYTGLGKMHKSKAKYRDIAITFGVQNLNLEEKLVFLRLTPLIFDAVNDVSFNVGSYEKATSWAKFRPFNNGMIALSIHSIRKGAISIKQLEKKINSVIGSLISDIEKHPEEVQYFIDCFQSTPNWNTFPIDYYRYTGIITSKNEIARAFKLKSITSILNRLELDVAVASPKHREHCD